MNFHDAEYKVRPAGVNIEIRMPSVAGQAYYVFCSGRKGIADAFGEFYKRLYEDSKKDNSEHEVRDDKRIPEITTEELQSAISKLKTGKSPDSNGIRAEDIKDCNDETREMMRQLLTRS